MVKKRERALSDAPVVHCAETAAPVRKNPKDSKLEKLGA